MGMQRTLVIIKPDAVARRLAGRIISRFEDKGLQIVGMKLTRITKAQARKHYAEHKKKPFYNGLLNFITSGPVILMAVEGVQAVSICRKMMGATFGFNAEPGSIRGDFGVSAGNNLIHGSDSVQSARRELKMYFKSGELVKHPPEELRWIYDYDDGQPR